MHNYSVIAISTQFLFNEGLLWEDKNKMRGGAGGRIGQDKLINKTKSKRGKIRRKYFIRRRKLQEKISEIIKKF